MSFNSPGKILAFAAILEVGAGLALMIDPAIVVALLFGASASGTAMPLGRMAGVALVTLGVACWPNRQRTEGVSPAFRAMLIYNVLIALYLAYLGAVEHLVGWLLWPGVALHATVAMLLVRTWRNERPAT